MIAHPTVHDLDARPAFAATAALVSRIAAAMARLRHRLRLGSPPPPAEPASGEPQCDLIPLRQDDCASVAPLASAEKAKPSGRMGITPREVEVLQLIAAGRTTHEIAAALVIAEPTVTRHITNLYAKIHVRSRSEATVFAFAHGLVSLPTP